MPLKTTCIDAFPKPGHSRAEHWRPVESATGQARQFTYVAEQTEAPGEDALDAVTRRAVCDQVACGIFIPTDRDTTRPSNVSPTLMTR